MRRQNESNVVWCIAAIGLFVVFSLCCFNEGLVYVGDNIFLHNRLVQIRDCLSNGLWPFLYYEDVGGIGYGSPIFYGQLTLFPFLPLAGQISSFLRVYYLCCLLLNFFAFRYFLKRVSSYATLTSCLYIFSMAFLGLFNGNIPANAMAVGFSWLFFAYCIDFFRDGNSFGLVILTYFAIWQSNFNSVVLATVVCFGIFLVYFRIDRIRSYVRLLVCVLLVVGFDIYNILSHLDAIALVDPSVLLSIMDVEADCRMTSVHPLGGILFRTAVLGVDGCVGFLSFGAFAVFVYYVMRYIRYESLRFRVCSMVIGVCALVGYIVGCCAIWPNIYRATNVFFQFPIRYYVILFGFVLAILSRVIRPSWFVYFVIILSIFDVFIVNPFRAGEKDDVRLIGVQLGNGEYASNEFLKNYDVYDTYGTSVQSSSGAVYSLEREYGSIEVDCSSNRGGDVITLPKLYYNWYRADGSGGEVFHVSSGYSNYCQVSLGSYTGVLRLIYSPPVLAYVLLGLQACSVLWLFSRLLVGCLSGRRRGHACSEGA